MKQTAVEWFAEKVGHNSLISLVEYNELFEQAKEMEKEQIIEAVESTIKSVELTEDKTAFFAMGGEGYYNETYHSLT